jgi:hypothetical protein
LKNSNFKNIMNDLEMKNFRKLDFRHITHQIKAFNNSFNLVLITPFYVNYNLIYDFATACLWKFTHFFILHGAISEKLQHIKIWKFVIFHTSCGTSSLPSMNKIGDGRVFSFVHSTWNDPCLNFTMPGRAQDKDKKRQGMSGEIRTSGNPRWGGGQPPRNSKVLTKLSRTPSSMENTFVIT